MPSLDFARARPLLQEGKLKQLFVEELGWEPCRQQMELAVGSQKFRLTGVAEKKGMVVWQCEMHDGRLPDRATRLKLDRQVTQTTFEHLLVFVTHDRTRQSWTWIRREPNRPISMHTHDCLRGQQADLLLQKLQILLVSLEEEEEGLSIADMAARARAAFNVEPVVKRFYEQFRKEHATFLKFITGISDKADHEWYASVMLNRLMFVYFVQRKGFLDGDPDYLRNRLRRMQREHGKDKFYSFYRYFLLRLFHEGLGGRKRPAELEKLIGKIPYLNGGIFDMHELESPERYGKEIQIPDKAFELVFEFFDQWQWHLDDRPTRSGNEINPDVLGYVYEKYINQKQMGAYYTKEDITEYISKNTIIPFLFDAARAKCKVAFENPNGPTVWDLLKNDPDRYIYPAVKHGMSWDYHRGEALDAPRPLPPEIEQGVNPPTLHNIVGDGLVLTLELRKHWNKPAPAEFALPTEIWREVVARRQRYEEVRGKLAAGEVRDINDLITFNLDIRQFAQDVIEQCEGPDLMRAFWHAIEKVTILDPTCGSGAFLFAALNILEPLYEACLDRMEAFLQDEAAKLAAASRRVTAQGVPILPRKKYSDFTEVLEHVAEHPSRRYFVYKSIILNNLYGVDIMEEAVEICKLRLFLKLAAQVEPDPAKSNYGIEPLPDIDFNIRAGNTLVGYVSLNQIREGARDDTERLAQFEATFERIEVSAADIQQNFDKFRERQVQGDGSVPTEHKQELRKRLNELGRELNHYLAPEYGVEPSKKNLYARWLKSHQPFHWFVEFFGIIRQGGFNVIIGNPPYVELKALTNYFPKGYPTEKSGNLYALVMERCASLARMDGYQGFIVPVSSVSTDRYETLQELLGQRNDHFSSFDDRPSRLFDGLEHIRLAIHIIGVSSSSPKLLSTCYNKWSGEERISLFELLRYGRSTPALVQGTLPKLSWVIEHSILQKLSSEKSRLAAFYGTGDYEVLYSRKVGYFLQVLDYEPQVLNGRGERRPPSEFKVLRFHKDAFATAALCCMNASLFYWFVTVFSDCRHLNKREIDALPIDLSALVNSVPGGQLRNLATTLMAEINSSSTSRTMRFGHDTLTIQCIQPKASKHIIDQIDQVLAWHFGFTEEELDFIINYDIKYRMGRDGVEGAGN